MALDPANHQHTPGLEQSRDDEILDFILANIR